MIQKLKSRKSRIKPRLFAFLLAERIIFGKKTHKTGGNSGFLPVFFFHVLHCYLVHFGSDFWFPHPSVPAAPLSLNFLSFLTLNANCSHHLSPSGSS